MADIVSDDAALSYARIRRRYDECKRQDPGSLSRHDMRPFSLAAFTPGMWVVVSEQGVEHRAARLGDAQRAMVVCDRACTLFEVGAEDEPFLIGMGEMRLLERTPVTSESPSGHTSAERNDDHHGRR
jgi:hypothetical protein